MHNCVWYLWTYPNEFSYQQKKQMLFQFTRKDIGNTYLIINSFYSTDI